MFDLIAFFFSLWPYYVIAALVYDGAVYKRSFGEIIDVLSWPATALWRFARKLMGGNFRPGG